MTMTRWKIVLLCSAAMTLVAGYALIGKRRPVGETPPSTTRPAHLACRFTPAEKLVFKLQSSAAVNEPDNPAPHRFELDALMWWRIVEQRGAAGWVVAAELKQVHLDEGTGDPDPAASAQYASPF